MNLLTVMLIGSSVMMLGPAGQGDRDYQLQPVPMTNVHLADGSFWQKRLETNRKVTIPHALQQCEMTGRISNFAKAAGRIEGEHEGYFFNDSDVYKVLEGACYALALDKARSSHYLRRARDSSARRESSEEKTGTATADEIDSRIEELDEYVRALREENRAAAELRARLDDLVELIAAAQQEDGYLNTFYTLTDSEPRWSDIRVKHELYCAGHLIEAAVAHHEATGERTLLDVAIRLADHIDSVFGPDARRDPPGHQEIEIALVKLYRTTGQQKYFDLARFFLDRRGYPTGHELYGPYAQDHKPVSLQEEAVGHAVRAAYMYTAMCDVSALSDDDRYLGTLGLLWKDAASRKTYITGSIGASRRGEAFGEAYELPNESAYAETCAAIANALWNDRMLRLHADSRYADIIERVIYNGFLTGVSLEGDTFFYPNPLMTDGIVPFNHGSSERSEWFACACCPSNDVRFFPAILSFLYSVSRDGAVYINQFAAGEAEMEVGGRRVLLRQETEYPWEGAVQIHVEPEEPTSFPLHVRVPAWARGYPMPNDLYRYLEPRADAEERISLTVNGEKAPLNIQHGYAVIDRTWEKSDTVELDLPMEVRRVTAHEQVEADRGRVALERGPIVYCIEAADHDGAALNIALPDDAELEARHREDLLGGVTTIHGEGLARNRAGATGEMQTQPIAITAIPYYAWNHRGAGEMTVWIPRSVELAEVPPVPTMASRAKASASHTWGSDTPRAINDQREPESSGDQTIPRQTWWDHRGTTEWAQLEFREPLEVSQVSVYWFDDTGFGMCRVPESWRLLYRTEGQWKPVTSPSEFAIDRDTHNSVEFDPVETDALRLEVKLQEEYSGGILECKVE